MTKLLLKFSLFLTMCLGASFAQQTCPSGTSPVTSAGTTIINNTVSYGLCVNNTTGVVTTPGGAAGGFTAAHDLTGSSTSQTVVGINGGTVPSSAACLGTNSAGQPVSVSCGSGSGLTPPPSSGIVTGTNGSNTTGVIAAISDPTNNNIFIGPLAGNPGATGNYNYVWGYQAGDSLSTTFPVANAPQGSVMIGGQAGMLTKCGLGSVDIGYQAGMTYSTGPTGCISGNPEDGLNVMIGIYAGKLENSIAETFIGQKAGANMTGTTNSDNVMLGAHSGQGWLSGIHNTFINRVADGSSSIVCSGDDNVVIAYKGLLCNTATSGINHNIIIGSQAGAVTLASDNLYIGFSAGLVGLGTHHTFIGYRSGQSMTTATDSTFMGYTSGWNATGGFNTYYGAQAGASAAGSTATNNVVIGDAIGGSITTGSNNVLIGSQAAPALTADTQDTIIGAVAGAALTNGTGRNAFYGYFSGHAANGSSFGNTFIGWMSGVGCTGCQQNTLVGYGTNIGAAVTNAIAIGNGVTVSASNTAVIGNATTVMTTEFGVQVSGGTALTFSTLPSASTVTRGCTWISDGAATPLYMAATAGGGSVLQLTCSNGTAWLNH